MRTIWIADFIVVDSYMGTVEYVGMKTTRLRSLDGEQIIFSNTELLKTRIRNYKRMQERRVLLELAIAFDSTITQIESIPTIMREIITAERAAARFERAHFKGVGESALLFEVVYFVLDPDYHTHMDDQQRVHLALLRQLRARGIVLAYPTRTVHVDGAAWRAGAATTLAPLLPDQRAAASDGRESTSDGTRRHDR